VGLLETQEGTTIHDPLTLVPQGFSQRIEMGLRGLTCLHD
jgi:hypothetical protein